MKGLGERVREIREAKGMTQRNVADSIGIDDYYISRLENGHINPTLLTLEKVAGALGIAIRDFFPPEKPEFKIPDVKLSGDLKKIQRLWEKLRPQHKWLMLRFVELTWKLDNPSARPKA
ncbi:MAG: helix-turn-helix transcriptional regulator [Acidobacteria bacterium]|nr:helix-turn-helix transcriptional regulator [Acidobacteriota bacterium]